MAVAILVAVGRLRRLEVGMQYFYREVIGRLLRAQIMRKDMELLVLCGGEADREVMREWGFTNVVISNVSHGHGDSGSYPSRQQDAENLTYGDGSFASPDRADQRA